MLLPGPGEGTALGQDLTSGLPRAGWRVTIGAAGVEGVAGVEGCRCGVVLGLMSMKIHDGMQCCDAAARDDGLRSVRDTAVAAAAAAAAAARARVWCCCAVWH